MAAMNGKKAFILILQWNSHMFSVTKKRWITEWTLNSG